MNFFDGDFGLGSMSSYNQKPRNASPQQIIIHSEKRKTLINSPSSQVKRMSLMTFQMICSTNSRRKITKIKKRMFCSNTAVVSWILVQIPMISKKHKSGVLQILKCIMFTMLARPTSNLSHTSMWVLHALTIGTSVPPPCAYRNQRAGCLLHLI